MTVAGRLARCSLAFSFSFTIIWHDENESRIIITAYDIYVYTLLYNDERGCTIWWPVNVLNISNLFFSPATSSFKINSETTKKPNINNQHQWQQQQQQNNSHHWYQIITSDSAIFSRWKIPIVFARACAFGDQTVGNFNLIEVDLFWSVCELLLLVTF